MGKSSYDGYVNIFYQLSVGSLWFVVIGEIPSTRLRSSSIALVIPSSSLSGIVMTVGLPYMFDAEWRGKTVILYSGLSSLCLIWSYVRLPETKDREIEEIDIISEYGVPAKRSFKSFRMDEIILIKLLSESLE